jgi:hypothetical protein
VTAGVQESLTNFYPIAEANASPITTNIGSLRAGPGWCFGGLGVAAKLITSGDAVIQAQRVNRAYCFWRWARSFSFSLQNDSRTSLSGTRSSVTFTVIGLRYILGSSMVTCRSIWPKSRR